MGNEHNILSASWFTGEGKQPTAFLTSQFPSVKMEAESTGLPAEGQPGLGLQGHSHFRQTGGSCPKASVVLTFTLNPVKENLLGQSID